MTTVTGHKDPLADEMKDVEKGVEGGLAAEAAVPPVPSSEETDGETKVEGSTSSDDDVSVADDGPEGARLEKQQSQAESFSKARILMIILSLCIALFLAALDMTIITTALPTIATEFDASDADYTWVGSAYLLACAAAVPAWGKFSDIFGRKPMLLACNVIFMAGSLFCALSTSIHMLIGARVLQGIGGGGLIILVNICVSDLFSLRERGKYIGIMGMVWAIASAVGPVLGGVFAEKVTWRWCFYINLPLDGFSVIMLTFFLKIHTPKTPLVAGLKAIDWLGVLLVVGGVVMFLLGLESGGVTHPWDSAYTICLTVFGVVTIGVFFLVEWKVAKYPVIPIRLFQSRTRCACLLTAFCHGFVFIAASYYLPLYFQTVLGATPLLSGVYTFPFALSLSICSACAGIIIKKTGKYQILIWGGMIIMTLGFGLFINLQPYASWPRIILFQIIAGIGVGPNFQSPLVALQTTIKPSDIATATATFGFVRQIATSLSVVLGGVVYQNQIAKQEGFLVSHLGAKLAAQIGTASSGAASSLIRSLPHSQRVIVAEVITSSLQKMWIFYTAMGALGIFFSFFIGKKVLSREVQTHKQGLEAEEEARQERLTEKKAKKEAKEDKKRRVSEDVEANKSLPSSSRGEVTTQK